MINSLLGSDNMFTLLLRRRVDEVLPLKPTDPSFNRIVDIIKEDIIAYINNHLALEEKEIVYTTIKYLFEDAKNIEELTAYLLQWYKKWIQRTKIVTKKEFDSFHTLLTSYNNNTRIITVEPKLLEQLRLVSIETLIEEKELACTHMLANDIVMYTLREYPNLTIDMKVPDQLRLMADVIRRTRAISKISGPLVYIGVGAVT